MSAYSSVLGVAVLLLHLWGTHSFPTSACPVPCLCQRGPLLNCSSLGLTTIPTRIPATAVSLNLSNNALRTLAPLSFGHVKLTGLLHLWVGSNALESLSLISEKERSSTRIMSSGEQECTSWASDLQLLSAERNHLIHLPKGLGCMKSLQILQLSHNQISKIGLSDLDNCSNLKELHLQHNRITSIHPNAFIDLKQLQLLDLSYNLLVTIPVPAYQSLRSLNALVDVSFNRWQCDCNLQTLRRWISFDTEMGDVSWQVVCASPPHHAGKDLLHLKDSELTCPTHEYSTSGRFHNMIVYEGTKISIPCSNDSKDITQVHWWTPRGQVTNNQPELLIKDITEQHAGLYVCISGVLGDHISVFDLHVYKKGSDSRTRREAEINLPRNDPVVRQGTRTQSEFDLAVSLSVIITFILAFILGVFLRPLLDKLWRRIRSKRQSSPPPPPTTSSTGPQPYVNEGYCDVEDQEQELRVGSRVTFGGITVEDQVPYYDTAEVDQADGSSESNTEASLYETVENKKSSITGEKQQALDVENHRGRADSSSSSSLQEGEINVLVINGKKLPPSSTKDMPKSMEFEPIPDANDVTRLRRGSSSASSNSSQEVNFSSELRESSVDPPPVTIPANQNTKSKVPGFTTEPFSEWPSRLTEQNVDELDPELWNDSGESFSFNEGSERSSIRDLSSSALGHPLKDDDTWRQGKVESPSDKKLHSGDIDKTFGKEVLVDDVKQFELSDIASLSNSSDSGESVGGPNKYIVNTELEESDVLDESDTENSANLVTLNRFGTFEDVTLDERMPSAGILIRQERMPSAGILIKQETITLEPSDIHLTFTHGNSVDEGMLIDDSQGNMYENISKKFAIFADVGLDTIPKVKRYVEFKPSKPHFERPTLPSLSEMDVKSEVNIDASSEETGCFSQIKVSPDTIQKVKRYIHFKHPEPHSPTLPTSPSLTKKDAMLEEKSYSSSSEDDAHLTTKDDNFFRTIGVSSDEVSKVKRYISFKPFDSSSTTSTNMETTTEATIKFTQPSTSPKDLSQNVKKYMFVKQHEHPSSSLPSSPTSSRKGLSGKKTKYKKRNDQSYYGSHESLPLYHVHPVYRSSINRLNRGYDTDRSISSEDEDQFMEYPRKLEITISPEMNRESIKPDKNTNKVLNIDFDNSSSSTDVFEKKQSKGLMRLRALSARLFNRHENETDEIRSPTGLDVGRTSGVSINKKPKLTKEQTTIEDSLFGRSLSLDNLPKVKRYLQFSHSDSFLQVQLPSSPPTTGVVTPDFIVKTESRRSSFSSEDDVKQTIEDKKFVGQVDASYEELPKVKRYIQFSHTEPYSTTMPLNKQSISTELVAQPEPKRPSSSSVDHIKLTSTEDNFFRKIGISLDTVPHVKRYIQFSQPKPYCPTLTSLPVSTKIPVVAAETSSSTSDKSDDKSNATVTFLGGQLGLDAVPKVKRYVQFKQSKPQSPTLSSDSSSSTTVTPKMEVKTEAKIDRSSGDQGYLTQIEVSPENIKKVKRYIQFQQSEPHSLPLPSHSLTKKDAILETRRYSSSSEDDIIPTTNKDNLFKEIGASFDGVPKVKGYIAFKQFDPSSDTLHVTPAVKTKSEARRSSTSSEDDAKLTAKEDNVFGKTEACLDRVPRVKRYIQFTHPESQSPVQTGLLSERVNVSVAVKQTRRWSTSSEEDVKPSTKKDNIIGETGEYLTEIPKVKRYIKFTQSEPYSSDLSPFPPSTVKSIKVTETEYRESTSSEDEFQENNGFGQMGASLDRIPRVKRYIEFTHPESQVPAQTTAEKANVTVVAKEQRRSSTSSEDDVKPSTNKDNIIEETTEYLAQIPKIKRYIKFTQAEQYPLDLSPFPSSSTVKAKVTETELRQPATRESTLFEDDIQEVAQVGASLDRVPKIKRYIQFTHPESQSLSQSTSAVSAERVGISVVDQESRRSSTSSEEDVTLTTKEDDVFGHIGASLDKIPKVKRYIQFTKPESEPLVQTTTPLLSERISGGFHETRSSTSSEVVVKPSTHDNNAIVEIPKVKRYIKFTQSEPSQGLAPFPIPSTVKSIKVTESRESSTLVEDNAQPYPKENIKEDNVFRQTEARLDRVPRVKRFIQFTHQSPEQSTTALSAERVGISEVISETRRLSISSADDDTLTAKEGEALDKIPKVKRYISFTNPESQSPVQTTPALSAEKVSVSVIAKETRRSSTSSEDDVKTSTNNDNIIGGKILDNIPKVKRYIEFTQYEPYSSAQLPSSNVVKSIKVTATELKGTSKSAEDDVQPAINVNKKESMTQSTSPDYLDGIPRVKRYIDFVPAESLYPARSSTAVLTERDEISRISSTLSKSIKPSSTDYKIIGETDKSFVGIPKVKRYIQFTHSEPHSSSKVSMKKGSALIIKTVNKESESRLSGFSFKDNIMTRESMGSSVEQASLRSSLSSLYSDKQSVGHQVMDVQPPQDEPPAVPLTSPPPLEQNDAREYLRQNSEVLQRQERRRLLQQRRTEMDKFNIASISSMQPEDDQQDKSPRDYRGATELQTEQTYSSISTRNTATSRHTEGAEAPVLRGLKTKNISASKEFLI